MQDLIKGGQLLSAGAFWTWAPCGRPGRRDIRRPWPSGGALHFRSHRGDGCSHRCGAGGAWHQVPPWPHVIATVRQRIATLSVAHKFQGIAHSENPCAAEPVRLLLSKAHHLAVRRAGGRRRKMRQPSIFSIPCPTPAGPTSWSTFCSKSTKDMGNSNVCDLDHNVRKIF